MALPTSMALPTMAAWKVFLSSQLWKGSRCSAYASKAARFMLSPRLLPPSSSAITLACTRSMRAHHTTRASRHGVGTHPRVLAPLALACDSPACCSAAPTCC